jgi:hypothetical protein
VADFAAALDAEDDEQDPSNELEDAANDKHSNSAIELAHVGSGARVVVVGIVGAVVGAGAVVRAAVRAVVIRVGGPCAHESTADDEADNGANEEADGPPFGEPRWPWSSRS